MLAIALRRLDSEIVEICKGRGVFIVTIVGKLGRFKRNECAGARKVQNKLFYRF